MIEIQNYNKYNKYYRIMLFTDYFDAKYFNIMTRHKESSLSISHIKNKIPP